MLPAIDAFLCAIRENRELRDGDRVQRRTADGGVVISTAPVRVDCHYVFTVNATPGGDPNLEDEHRILGEVMRVLLRFRQIPARYLQGCLVDMEPPVRAASILPPGGHESGSDLWTALKQTMRACLHYTVTIAVDPGLPTEAATPVTSIQFSGGV